MLLGFSRIITRIDFRRNRLSSMDGMLNFFGAGSKATPGKAKPATKNDTGCDMSQEELLALLKGISYEKPKSLAKTPVKVDEDCYLAPSAAAVLAEDDDEPEVEAESGDFASRFASKAWKVREAAFGEAKTLFAEGDGSEAVFKTWAPFMAAAADDSNASANDSALEMITAW